jgi:20S proteasome alpha/beta subunit
MTICIAAHCKHDGRYAIVLCADYQGTRGDYIKADDTYKLWHFHRGHGAIGFAGDVDCGTEFAMRFTAVARQFHELEKTRDDGDMDLRIGRYLGMVRDLAAEFKKERIDFAIRSRFGIGLNEYYALDVAKRDPGILNTINSVEMGAEFLIAYLDDQEPLFIRIEQSGYVMIDDGEYVAIGSGEPLATAIFSQIEEEVQTLPECLTWVYQAKLAAENNPYVGKKTVIWILLEDGRELLPSEEAWQILEATPGISLAPVDPQLTALGDGLFTEHPNDFSKRRIVY